MNFPASAARLMLPLTAALLLSACGGATQKYYQLTADRPAPTAASGLRAGIGPITLPGYLDRAELVYQNGPNQFQIPADAHWAGSLKENISRVLASNVGNRLRSGNVLSYPWTPDARLRYRVAVDIQQFHAISGTGAVLDVSWRVELPEGGPAILRRNASYRERVEGDGYDAVVAAENRLLAQLADGIASSLRSAGR